MHLPECQDYYLSDSEQKRTLAGYYNFCWFENKSSRHVLNKFLGCSVSICTLETDFSLIMVFSLNRSTFHRNLVRSFFFTSAFNSHSVNSQQLGSDISAWKPTSMITRQIVLPGVWVSRLTDRLPAGFDPRLLTQLCSHLFVLTDITFHSNISKTSSPPTHFASTPHDIRVSMGTCHAETESWGGQPSHDVIDTSVFSLNELRMELNEAKQKRKKSIFECN